MCLILSYESAVIDVTAKEASLPIAASGSMDGSWASTWFLGAAQIVDNSMVSGGSIDDESLSRRLNPEDESFFISDTLLLLRVRMIM